MNDHLRIIESFLNSKIRKDRGVTLYEDPENRDNIIVGYFPKFASCAIGSRRLPDSIRRKLKEEFGDGLIITTQTRKTVYKPKPYKVTVLNFIDA